MKQVSGAARFLALATSGAFLVGLVGCGHAVAPAGRPPVVRIAIQPAYSLVVMSQQYRPLIEYLSKETGYRVEQVSALSQSSYLSAIEGAGADVAFLNPLFYLQVAKTKGAYPLARAVNQDGSDRYRGVIITRAESRIRSLQELRGCIAMTSSKKGTAGYLGQYKLLKENGIDLDRDLTVVVGRTQDEVALAVAQGKVQVGFVREDFVRAVGGAIAPRRIRILAYTDYFPTWCFVAFRETEPAVAAAVKEALLRLDPQDPTHRPVLERAQAARFVPASDADYDDLRATVARLGLPY